MTARTARSHTAPADRLRLLFLVFACSSVIIAARLFTLQILRNEYYLAMAEDQHELLQKVQPKRGGIYAQDTRTQAAVPLAVNKKYGWLYATPKNVVDQLSTADRLQQLLGYGDDQAKRDELVRKLSSTQSVAVPIARKLNDEQRQQVEDAKIPGLYFVDETYRFYPQKEDAAHVVGFLGFVEDRLRGQYGVEGHFDTELSGKSGEVRSERDARGNLIPSAEQVIQQAENGSQITLTIDANIQHRACKALRDNGVALQAIGGALVMIDPHTGAILAMCSFPDFDPNVYNQVENIEVYKNHATSFAYEPGSVFKTFTMAAALDAGKVTPQTTYDDTGSVVINKYTIQNSDKKSNGVQTMTNVLEKSLNTGIIFAMRQATPEVFGQYVRAFGFGEKIGAQVGTEAQGNISSLDQQAEIFPATAAFGQGLTATPLQLAAAYAAIANNGMRMQPYIIAKITKPDGSEIVTQPRAVQQVVTEKTAKTLAAMLVSVVENGHAKNAYLPNYYIGGKTGTAQKPGTDGKYTSAIYGTFAGFGPMNNPRFAMAVMYDEPKVEWAESAATPVFRDVAQYALQYYHVEPER